MTHRNNLGAHTIAILAAVEKSGPSTARQATDAWPKKYPYPHQVTSSIAQTDLKTGAIK